MLQWHFCLSPSMNSKMILFVAPLSLFFKDIGAIEVLQLFCGILTKCQDLRSSACRRIAISLLLES